MSVNSKMTALADEIRELSGTSEAIGLDAMKAHVNEANTNIATEADLIEQIVDALEGKATGNGEQATPEISVNSNGLITATAGTKSSTHQLAFQPAKTITPSTASQVVVSSGYYTGGNITVAGDSNLVAGNIKNGVSIFGVSGTLVTGNSGNGDILVNNMKAIASSAFYNCDDIEIASFPKVTSIHQQAFNLCGNLTIANFPSCTRMESFVFNQCYNLREISFPQVQSIGSLAFRFCSNLMDANFPKVKEICPQAFEGCIKLTTANFPVCSSVHTSAFRECRGLTTINFPVCSYVGTSAFAHCTELTVASLPECSNINANTLTGCYELTTVYLSKCSYIDQLAFSFCYNLSSFTLNTSTVCRLHGSNVFSITPYTGYTYSFSGTPYIYVPQSLLTSYKTATNWVYFSSYFSAIEDVDTSGNNKNVITFTISDVEYQAEEGMTWAEWIESEYNTGNYFINFYDYISKDNNETRWVRDSSDGGAGYQQSSVQIIENTSYNLSSAPII